MLPLFFPVELSFSYWFIGFLKNILQIQFICCLSELEISSFGLSHLFILFMVPFLVKEKCVMLM